jgi:predicted RNA-binding Zn ribbon-like protein
MAGAPRAIPPYLEPVHAFVNTVDVEEGTDLLTGPAELTAWLRTAGLLGAAGRATAAQLRLALDLRQVLRAFALANNGVAPSTADLTLARRCFDRLPVIAGGTGEVPLQPRSTAAVPAALTRIVAGYATARAAGEWTRLRRCPADDCAWVFWDSTPRSARRWCSMRVCGNRAKARTYASRTRTQAR